MWGCQAVAVPGTEQIIWQQVDSIMYRVSQKISTHEHHAVLLDCQHLSASEKLCEFKPKPICIIHRSKTMSLHYEI